MSIRVELIFLNGDTIVHDATPDTSVKILRDLCVTHMPEVLPHKFMLLTDDGTVLDTRLNIDNYKDFPSIVRVVVKDPYEGEYSCYVHGNGMTKLEIKDDVAILSLREGGVFEEKLTWTGDHSASVRFFLPNRDSVWVEINEDPENPHDGKGLHERFDIEFQGPTAKSGFKGTFQRDYGCEGLLRIEGSFPSTNRSFLNLRPRIPPTPHRLSTESDTSSLSSDITTRQLARDLL